MKGRFFYEKIIEYQGSCISIQCHQCPDGMRKVCKNSVGIVTINWLNTKLKFAKQQIALYRLLDLINDAD